MNLTTASIKTLFFATIAASITLLTNQSQAQQYRGGYPANGQYQPAAHSYPQSQYPVHQQVQHPSPAMQHQNWHAPQPFADVAAFAQKFVVAGNSNDVWSNMYLFNHRVENFFGIWNCDHSKVAHARMSYNKCWPNRCYSMVCDPQIRQLCHNTYEVITTVSFQISSQCRCKSDSGVVKNRLKIIRNDCGHLKVLSAVSM